jgi:hypothetical protein
MQFARRTVSGGFGSEAKALADWLPLATVIIWPLPIGAAVEQ